MSDTRSDFSPHHAGEPDAKAEAAPPASAAQKGPIAELLSDGFGLDWSVPRTFWALLRRPAEVADAYRQRRSSARDPLMAEQARRFVSPFKYIVLAAAVATFLSAFVIDMNEAMRRAGEESLAMASSGQASTADLPAAYRHFMAEAQAVGANLMTKYAALTHLFIYTPVMALITCLVFRRKEASFTGAFPHHLGLSAYMWAEFTLLALTLVPLALVMDSTLMHNNIELILMCGYVVWAQVKFFDLSGGKGILKASAAFVGAFVLITLVLGVVMFGTAYVRVFL